MVNFSNSELMNIHEPNLVIGHVMSAKVFKGCKELKL